MGPIETGEIAASNGRMQTSDLRSTTFHASSHCSTGPADRFRAASNSCWPWRALAGKPSLLLDKPAEGIQLSIIEEIAETEMMSEVSGNHG